MFGNILGFFRNPKAESYPALVSDDPIDVTVFSVNGLSMKGSAWIGTEAGPGSHEIEFRFGNRDLMEQAMASIKYHDVFVCMISPDWVIEGSFL